MIENHHHTTPEYWWIQEYLKKNPESTTGEIAKGLNLSYGQIQSSIITLLNEGKIYMVGLRQTYQYVGVGSMTITEKTWSLR